jgi:hypothetical protein
MRSVRVLDGNGRGLRMHADLGESSVPLSRLKVTADAHFCTHIRSTHHGMPTDAG